jgi:hypothetical protein
MKLQTSIKPRRDGTVLVTGQDGVKYTFVAGAAGDLECAIEHQATLKHLLASQNFYPASEDDFSLALQMSQPAGPGPDADADAGAPDLGALAAKSDAELDEEGDEGDLSGLPVEANTPPQTAPDRAARKNGALQAATKTARK